MTMIKRTLIPAFAFAALTILAATAPANAREVWPGELMTFQERHEMMTGMLAARSPEERMQLWVSKRAELQKRAAERGLTLRDGSSGGMMMMRSGIEGRENRPEGQRWGQSWGRWWGGTAHAGQRPTPLVSR